MRQRIESVIVYLCTALLIAAFVMRLVTRGGPYFARPQTIVDHVGPGKHETRDALVLLPKVEKLIPRGAEVTCFRPIEGTANADDTANFYTAVGQLPRQQVQPPFTAMLTVPTGSLVEYVVAVGGPFDHPAYRVIAEFPEGRLYKVER